MKSHSARFCNHPYFLILVCLGISVIFFTSPVFAGGILYSTFLGGSGDDLGTAIAVDSAGNIYITGYSSSNNYPTTSGAFDTTYNSNSDVIVSKLDASGSNLLYSTYLGGGGSDRGYGIAVDNSGNAYITGWIGSNDFPVTPGAYDTTWNGINDLFVTKLNSNGSSLIYSTYLGGTGFDYGYGIALDNAGNVYVTGYNINGDYPVTAGAFDTTFNGGNYDVIVTKLNADGSSLIYSTYIGSNEDELGFGIAVDSTGNAYITGFTTSSTYPVTAGAFDTTFNGIDDVIISKLNASGSNLIYSTYLGGSRYDFGYGIAVDSSGNIYITGYNNEGHYPVTNGAFDTTYHGGNDVIVSKLDSSGTKLLYSTYLGGNGFDYGYGIAVDNTGNATITGYTESTNYPVTAGAYDTTYNGGLYDLIVSKLDSSGTKLLYSTFLGGTGDDEGFGIAVNNNGNAYITGFAGPDYPVTAGAFDTTYNGGKDIVVTKLYTILPIVESLPSLKLFVNQELAPAFNLADYNPDGTVSEFTIQNNFLNLSSLIGSTVYQGSYISATSGSNTYLLGNTYNIVPQSNKVKYSYFKINKLPKVGLNSDSSWDINVAKYTLSQIGPVLSFGIVDTPVYPASYGNSSAILVSDTTLITATWLDNTSIRITALPGFTSGNPVSVDVIASIYSDPPYTDQDKERIWVYPNLLPKSTFSTGQDTTTFGFELAPGKSVMATIGWVSSASDSQGISADGVMTITFPSGSAGIKGTPFTANRVSYQSGQWYTARMRVTGNAGNTHQSLLFNFSNDALSINGHVDLAAYVLFGTPSTWTWLETPIYSNETGKGFPQFQFKAGNAGTIYVDEIQIINAAPTLVDANRYITRIKYPYGDFDAGGDTTGWGRQVYTGAGSAPTFDVTNGELVLNFAGATTSSGQKGLKWTANNGAAGTLYTPNNIQGREVGLRVSLTKESGNFNTLSAIVLLGVYGVETNGQQTIGQTPSDLIASAEYGRLTNGIHRAVGISVNAYHQFQFGIKNDQTGVLHIDNVDYDSDNDDPNYGDGSLFP